MDCIPCFFKQALNAARAATHDEEKARTVLDRISTLVPDIPLDQTPPETARIIYSIVQDITGISDPFKTYKEDSIHRALSLYGDLKSKVACSEDPLYKALTIAIAGNVIDLGAHPDLNLDAEIRDIEKYEISLDSYEPFKRKLERADRVLYLGDNAGETVFDRILIETLGKDTIYAVRDAPVINDATIEDARKSGLGFVAKIISSGCDAPGTILKQCSREFLDIFETADVIVSKGQGNFESLSKERAPIFFLFKVKCSVVSRHAGAQEGEIILKESEYGSAST